jgi:hypothetical protein
MKHLFEMLYGEKCNASYFRKRMRRRRTLNSKVHGHEFILSKCITAHYPILIANCCGVHSKYVRSTSICFMWF